MSWGQKKEGGEKVPFPRFLLLGALMKLRGKLEEEEEDGLSTTHTPHSPPFFPTFFWGGETEVSSTFCGIGLLLLLLRVYPSYFPSFLFPPLFYIGCKTKPRNSIVWRWEKAPPPPKKSSFFLPSASSSFLRKKMREKRRHPIFPSAAFYNPLTPHPHASRMRRRRRKGAKLKLLPFSRICTASFFFFFKVPFPPQGDMGI